MAVEIAVSSRLRLVRSSIGSELDFCPSRESVGDGRTMFLFGIFGRRMFDERKEEQCEGSLVLNGQERKVILSVIK